MDARTSAIFPLSIIFPLSVIIFPLFEYAELNGGVHFIRFRLEITFLEKLIQKVKIVSLSWNVSSRLIRICRIQ